MQPPTASPREAYTEAEIVALIRDASDSEFGAGCEVLDMDLALVEDISATLHGGQIQRDSYAIMHAGASLDIGQTLDWGAAIVRPFVTIDGVRFDQGAYFTSVPARNSVDPFLYSVACHDILLGLATRVGAAYIVDNTVPVLTAVEEILVAQGFSQYIIDPERATATLPTNRVWPIDDNTTWLTIVNDLLASVGYAGIWSDWHGRLRCHLYVGPRDRAAEWVYYADGDASQLSIDRTITADFFDTPNRWVAVRQNNIEGDAPIEGDGVYTFTNDTIGPTSVEARGRIITAPLIMIDAVDQAALIAAVNARSAADMSVPTTMDLSIPIPNPLHWHMDRVYLADAEFGGLQEILVSKWNLPLAPNLGDAAQTWTVL